MLLLQRFFLLAYQYLRSLIILLPFFLNPILPILLLRRFVESIVYYGVSFGSILLGGNIYLSFFIINSAEIPGTIISIWTIER